MKHFLSIIAIGFLFHSPLNAQSHFKFFEPVDPPRKVQIMVHRGMHMMAPENSLPAILACASDYLEWAEVDVRLTKDGKHVILHDDTLDRTTSGTGKVKEISSEEFLKLDAGSKFASRFKGTTTLSLSRLLEECKGKLNLYLDCKDIDADLLVKEIQTAKMESQVIVYHSPDVLKQIQRLSKNSIATMTKYRPESAEISNFIARVNPSAVEIDADQVTPAICSEFHSKGIKVQAKVLGTKWDRPDIWQKMIDAKVDWLQTDYPAELRFLEVRSRIAKFPVKIACHRGANRYAPENTLAAIRKAAAIGADYIEFDIRTTKDQQFVIMHDRNVNRTTTAQGNVRDLTFFEITKLDAGSWFGKAYSTEKPPTLDEALIAIGSRSHAYLDAKDIAPEKLIEIMKKQNLLERSAVYQTLDYQKKLRAIEPRVRTMPPLSAIKDFDSIKIYKPFAVDARWSILSEEMIANCHREGIQVFSDALGLWENIEQYQKAIQWGIDTIQTDHPLRVLRAIELNALKSKN